MDTVPKEDLQDIEETIYQDGPMRARRRQSDAKWRASVATCYDTLKHVVPKGHSVTKRKVSKAVILQESERHILHLESILSHLINSESQANGKAVLWKADSQWSKCTLKNFQDDFAKKQHKIFHSSNQGRRCYNLLDEIKEEIFSMAVDSETISVMDKESVSTSKCVDKLSGKEISLFSQLPSHCTKKETSTTVKNSVESAITQQHKKKLKYFESCPDDFVASKTLAHCFEREDQIVPSLSSPLSTSQASHSNTLCQTTFSTSTLPSLLPSHNSNMVALNKNDSSDFLNMAEDNDQEVPSFETVCNSGNDNSPSANTAVHFLSKLSHFIGSMDSSASCSNNKMNNEKKSDPNFFNSLSTSSQSVETNGVHQQSVELKTPGITISVDKFKEKCLQSSTLLRPLIEKKCPADKPATARKLNFSRPDFVGAHHKLSEQRERHHQACASPMLAGFTPVKLAPNFTYCVTCKPPDDSLVSPWKAFNSPLYGDFKKHEKSPMIDLDNNLFCFETMDSILAKDNGDDERTPSLHSLYEEKNVTQQPFKRKISCQSVDMQDKSEPKCRKRLEGYYDFSVCKALHSDMCHSKVENDCNEEAQVVPDCQHFLTPQSEKVEGGEGNDFDVTNSLYNNDDATDFDGFFFYFRQIGQQLKHQQKLSCKGIQSPSVAAKVLKMWMRLPSPDKQTIKTLAALESQGLSPSLQVKMGDLSQDLQDVDVTPIDLKEFIPTTPV